MSTEQSIQEEAQGKRVLLVVPTLDGKVTASIMRLVQEWSVGFFAGKYPHAIMVDTVVGQTPVAHARNECVKKFLANKDADVLWMMDADTLPVRDTIKVLDGTADICIAPVPMFTASTDGMGHLSLNLFHEMDTGGLISWKPGGPEPANGGTGCIVLSRKILTDSRLVIGDEPWEVFGSLAKATGEVIFGEDVDFINRARTLGYGFEVCMDAQCDHQRQVGLNHYAKAVLHDHGSHSTAYTVAHEEAKRNNERQKLSVTRQKARRKHDPLR